MKVRNFTNHEINFLLPGGRRVTLPPDPEGPARVVITREQVGTVKVNGAKVPVFAPALGEVHGLPDPEPGTYYVVSRIVAMALAGKRHDLLVPDQVVKDGEGRPLGSTALAVPRKEAWPA